MDALTAELLVCPKDLGILSSSVNGFRCERCGNEFIASEGVLDLLPPASPEPQQLRENYNATFSQRPDRPWMQPLRTLIAEFGNSYLYSWSARNIEKVAAGKSLTVLDAACGDGMLHRRISRRHRYIGVDFSARPLIRAARSCPGDYFRGDLTRLPFADNSFDLAVSLQAFQYLEHPNEAVQQIARVLKAGGRFLLSVPNCGSIKYRLQGLPSIQLQRFDRENVTSLLSPHFEVQEIATRGLWLPLPKIGVHLAGKYSASSGLSWTVMAVRRAV
jgi:SAM-dependent methyltransferase